MKTNNISTAKRFFKCHEYSQKKIHYDFDTFIKLQTGKGTLHMKWKKQRGFNIGSIFT